MELATFLVNSVLVEHKSVADVAAAHDVSRSWLYELLACYREGGEEALVPGSRRPVSSPSKVASALENEIVALRKSPSEEGLDAGPHTIHYHLQKRHRRSCQCPSMKPAMTER